MPNLEPTNLLNSDPIPPSPSNCVAKNQHVNVHQITASASVNHLAEPWSPPILPNADPRLLQALEDMAEAVAKAVYQNGLVRRHKDFPSLLQSPLKENGDLLVAKLSTLGCSTRSLVNAIAECAKIDGQLSRACQDGIKVDAVVNQLTIAAQNAVNEFGLALATTKSTATTMA